MPFCRMLSDLEKRVMGVQSVVVVFQDRETAHLEFPDGVQLPTSDAHGAEGDDDDDRGSGSASDSKHKKVSGARRTWCGWAHLLLCRRRRRRPRRRKSKVHCGSRFRRRAPRR